MPLPALTAQALTPRTVAALARAAGLTLDPERQAAVAAVLAAIRAETARLNQPCLADARLAQHFDPDWR